MEERCTYGPSELRESQCVTCPMHFRTLQLLKRREFVSTLFEILLPVVISVAMIGIFAGSWICVEPCGRRFRVVILAPYPHSATKSLDQNYPTTSYSQPWTPQENAYVGSSTASRHSTCPPAICTPSACDRAPRQLFDARRSAAHG